MHSPESPTRRAWRRFRSNRLGYVSLLVFGVLFGVSLVAELVSNDKPLLARYDGHWYFPVLQTLPETTFGGDFPAPADYLDDGRRSMSLLELRDLSVDFGSRRVVDRVSFALDAGEKLALVGESASGMLFGAIQGYFAGWIDIFMERFKEIWGAMPVLYMLIIFSSLFSPSFWLLVILISVFGWLGIAAYVRAEFLKNRTLDYVRAARALGQGNWLIMWRHILPNSLTPVVTLVPFEMAAAIGALTSLDFLGLGVPPGTPSLGELLNQGKNHLYAWWIALST